MWSNPELRSWRRVILDLYLSLLIATNINLILILDKLASNIEYFKSSNNIGCNKQQAQSIFFYTFAMFGRLKICYISNLIK